MVVKWDRATTRCSGDRTQRDLGARWLCHPDLGKHQPPSGTISVRKPDRYVYGLALTANLQADYNAIWLGAGGRVSRRDAPDRLAGARHLDTVGAWAAPAQICIPTTAIRCWRIRRTGISTC
jgi:hypothetical protein